MSFSLKKAFALAVAGLGAMALTLSSPDADAVVLETADNGEKTTVSYDGKVRIATPQEMSELAERVSEDGNVIVSRSELQESRDAGLTAAEDAVEDYIGDSQIKMEHYEGTIQNAREGGFSYTNAKIAAIQDAMGRMSGKTYEKAEAGLNQYYKANDLLTDIDAEVKEAGITIGPKPGGGGMTL